VCDEGFELKSTKSPIRKRLMDGAHAAMMRRMSSERSPSLLILRYDRTRQEVVDLIGVPRQFFVPAVIQARKPLAPTARRAGWVGCNILLDQIPEAGKVDIIRAGALAPRETVVDQWNATSFLRGRDVGTRSWLLVTLRCVEAVAVPGGQFTLADIYRFEGELARQFPANANIRPKLRQQLQVLRDAGVLTFLGGGLYQRSRG
jgi:type II restriction enzyme